MKLKILFLFINILLLTGCTTSKLYKYTQYPCENKTFKTPIKMALVTYGHSGMRESLYYITRDSLENYRTYLASLKQALITQTLEAEKISNISIRYRGVDIKTGEDKGVDFTVKLK